MKLPYLEVKGTYREIGQQIGERFKDRIQSDIRESRKTVPDYQELLQKSQEYYKLTKQYLPNLINELEAIAKAASVPAIEYFFNKNREVYDIAESWDKKDAVYPDHCTVVVGYGKDSAVVGHNEDWSLDALDNLYVLKATIGDTTFTGLNYCTVIAGLAASMNNWGLVQCINDIYSVNQMGVPKNFIARAVLECKTLDEAEKLIREIPRASGFNHVLVQGNEIRNIEIAGDKIAVEKIIRKPYVHTNHFLNDELKTIEKFHTKSSEERYNRVSELLKDTMEKQDIINILSDTQNSQYPICRKDETIGSAVFLAAKDEANFCYGHPCAGEFVKYII